MKTLGQVILADMEQLRPMELLRANSVQRFSMSPMTRDQTIAAHQWDVAMLYIFMSKYITKGTISMDKDDSWLLTGILLGLSHDMGEIFTGDAPAPFKQAFNLIVNDSLPNWVARMLVAWGHDAFSHRDILLRRVVKTADVLSTWFWAKQYGNPGDTYTNRMTQNLEGELGNHLCTTARMGKQYGYCFHRYWFDLPDRFTHHITGVNSARNISDLEMEDEYDEEQSSEILEQ